MNESISNDSEEQFFHCPIETKDELNVLKLRSLFNNMGFNPTSKGTQYLIEELKYSVENKIEFVEKVEDITVVSAQIHNCSLDKVYWDIRSAINVMNKNCNEDVVRSIFMDFNRYNVLTPRRFLIGMIDYLNENIDEYKK